MKIKFGKVVDIDYLNGYAHASCVYDENEDFLNNLFYEFRRMSISDDNENPAYFLEPIIRKYFKKKAYTDFVEFLKSEGIYSDVSINYLVFNKEGYDKLLRMSSVICGYQFN